MDNIDVSFATGITDDVQQMPLPSLSDFFTSTSSLSPPQPPPQVQCIQQQVQLTQQPQDQKHGSVQPQQVLTQQSHQQPIVSQQQQTHQPHIVVSHQQITNTNVQSNQPIPPSTLTTQPLHSHITQTQANCPPPSNTTIQSKSTSESAPTNNAKNNPQLFETIAASMQRLLHVYNLQLKELRSARAYISQLEGKNAQLETKIAEQAITINNAKNSTTCNTCRKRPRVILDKENNNPVKTDCVMTVATPVSDIEDNQIHNIYANDQQQQQQQEFEQQLENQNKKPKLCENQNVTNVDTKFKQENVVAAMTNKTGSTPEVLQTSQ